MTVRLKITLLITVADFLSSLVLSIITLVEMVERPFDLIDAELRTMVRRAVQHQALAHTPGAKRDMPSFFDQERDWLEISVQGSGVSLYRSSRAQYPAYPQETEGAVAFLRSGIPAGFLSARIGCCGLLTALIGPRQARA